jgi:hypothetical protein
VVSFTPRPLYHRERVPGTHWIRGWVGPRAGLDDVDKRKFLTLPGLELQPLRHPVRSQSLYLLRYPGSLRRTVSQLISTQVDLSVLFGTSRHWVVNKETLSLSFRKLIVWILFSVISRMRVAYRIPQQRQVLWNSQHGPQVRVHLFKFMMQGLPNAQSDFRWNSTELT